MYNAWEGAECETKRGFICKQRERHVCQMEGDIMFIFENPQLLPVWCCVSLCVCLCCIMLNLFLSCGLPPFCQAVRVCVCLSSLLYFSTGSARCRWILNQHHHHQYDSSIFLLFEGSIFLSREGKETRTLFTLLLSAEMTLKMWTKTLEVWCCRRTFSFFPPSTVWIRVGGGNWRGGWKLLFSHTAFLMTIRYMRLKETAFSLLFLTKCSDLWFALLFHWRVFVSLSIF